MLSQKDDSKNQNLPYQDSTDSKASAIDIPSANADKQVLASYYEKVDNLIKRLNQNARNSYDLFLTNEVLDHQSSHLFSNLRDTD